MPDRRALHLDLAATGLLLAGFLLALCVFSHDTTGTEPHEPADNVFGFAGTWLAHSLAETLGLAVYALLAGWFVAVLVLFLRRNLARWSMRLVGWLLLVPAAAAAADLLGSPNPAEAGGVLGAWLNLWLRDALGAFGHKFGLATAGLLALGLALDAAALSLLSSGKRCCKWALGILKPNQNRQTPALADDLPIRRPASGRAPKASQPEVAPPHEAEEVPIHRPEPVTKAETEQASEPAPRSPVPIRRPAAIPQDGERFAAYELPPLTLLEDPAPFPYEEHDQRLRERATLLEQTFIDFGLNVRVVGINTGPVITQYEVALETGLRVNKVTSLADDLALNLKVSSVRVVAPIPGKNTVGIEVPNEHRAMVRLKEVIQLAGKKVAKSKVPLFLGKDTEGQPLVYDLAEMPHLLIAGRTGTGKSVCMNAVILSILMTRRPDEVKMVMIDPKMLELSEYGRIPHLMHPVVKDMKKAEAILAWAVDKMEERYDLLSRARVRGIAGYNELSFEEILRRVQPEEEERGNIPEKMPYVIIFVDEMNDLMMTMKREVEGHIIRLAQKSRAAGIHLVVATQKPTVDVITGLIKSNLPARICFQVSSRTDSRVVLDEMGAEKLLGKGDMLFLQPGTSTLVRSQGTYASDEEISRVVEALECDEPCYVQELVQLKSGGDGKEGFLDTLRARDDIYEAAIEVVIREGRGSVSLLQRALGIGYGRAARLIDFMAEDGIVGTYNGSAAREVLYTLEQWEGVKSAACS